MGEIDGGTGKIQEDTVLPAAEVKPHGCGPVKVLTEILLQMCGKSWKLMFASTLLPVKLRLAILQIKGKKSDSN